MNRNSSILAMVVAVGLAVSAAPVFAQSTATVSAEEIGRKLKEQATYRQANSACPAGQKCRSLTRSVTPTYRGLAVVPGSVDQTNQGTLTLDDLTVENVTTVDYTPVPEEMQVNVRIMFDFDSAALRADQWPILIELCQGMKDSEVARFRIIGHTDAVGSDSYNQRLSLLRAEEVKRQLISGCGMASTRLETIGMGESILLLPNAPRADDNRRVEFQVRG